MDVELSPKSSFGRLEAKARRDFGLGFVRSSSIDYCYSEHKHLLLLIIFLVKGKSRKIYNNQKLSVIVQLSK